jgi:hypothetical protein
MSKNIQTLIEERIAEHDGKLFTDKEATDFLRKSMEMAYTEGRFSFMEEWLPKELFEAYKKLQSPKPEKEEK